MTTAQSTSLDAAVGVTGTVTPLIDASTGRPCRHVVYSCSDGHLCSELEDVHPSVVAVVPKGTEVKLHEDIVDNVVMVKCDDDEFVIVERTPLSMSDGDEVIAMRANSLTAVFAPLSPNVGVVNAFSVEELANSTSGDGIIFDVVTDSAASASSASTDAGEVSLCLVDEDGNILFEVIAAVGDDGLYPTIASRRNGNRVAVVIWTSALE